MFSEIDVNKLLSTVFYESFIKGGFRNTIKYEWSNGIQGLYQKILIISKVNYKGYHIVNGHFKLTIIEVLKYFSS